MVEDLTALGDRGKRRSDAAGSDDENLHGAESDAKRRRVAAEPVRARMRGVSAGRLPYAAPIRVAPNTRRP